MVKVEEEEEEEDDDDEMSEPEVGDEDGLARDGERNINDLSKQKSAWLLKEA